MATVKLKDWTSEPCSDVCGTNLTRHGREAQVSLTRLLQHTKHREGVCTEGGQRVGQKLATGASLPLVCSSMQARCVCAGSPAASMSEVTAGPGSGWHLLLQVCRREQRCSWPGRQPSPFPAGAGQVSNSWLAETMSVPASLYRCPHHSAGEGRVNWRYQLCCWGM